MNLNNFARDIALLEGGKKEVSIAQIKQIIRLTLKRLANLPPKEVTKILERHSKA